MCLFIHIGTCQEFKKINDSYDHLLRMQISSFTKEKLEEMAKEKITSTIRNNAKWLLNADGTGAILYAEFSDGTYPITNAKGQKIETSFLNPTSTYPVTGDELPLIDYVDPYGAVEYEEVVND